MLRARRLAYLPVFAVLAAVLWYGLVRHPAPRADGLPTTLDEFKQRPGGASTVEAGEFLMTLAREGKLPGFSAGEHGTMHAGILDAKGNTPPGAGSEPYPVSRTVHFQKEGDAGDYFYIVVRESRASPWKLQKAWRTGADGQVVETYPVP